MRQEKTKIWIAAVAIAVAASMISTVFVVATDDSSAADSTEKEYNFYLLNTVDGEDSTINGWYVASGKTVVEAFCKALDNSGVSYKGFTASDATISFSNDKTISDWSVGAWMSDGDLYYPQYYMWNWNESNGWYPSPTAFGATDDPVILISHERFVSIYGQTAVTLGIDTSQIWPDVNMYLTYDGTTGGYANATAAAKAAFADYRASWGTIPDPATYGLSSIYEDADDAFYAYMDAVNLSAISTENLTAGWMPDNWGMGTIQKCPVDVHATPANTTFNTLQLGEPPGVGFEDFNDAFQTYMMEADTLKIDISGLQAGWLASPSISAGAYVQKAPKVASAAVADTIFGPGDAPIGDPELSEGEYAFYIFNSAGVGDSSINGWYKASGNTPAKALVNALDAAGIAHPGITGNETEGIWFGANTHIADWTPEAWATDGDLFGANYSFWKWNSTAKWGLSPMGFNTDSENIYIISFEKYINIVGPTAATIGVDNTGFWPDSESFFIYDGTTGGYANLEEATEAYFFAYQNSMGWYQPDPEQFGLTPTVTYNFYIAGTAEEKDKVGMWITGTGALPSRAFVRACQAYDISYTGITGTEPITTGITFGTNKYILDWPMDGYDSDGDKYEPWYAFWYWNEENGWYLTNNAFCAETDTVALISYENYYLVYGETAVSLGADISNAFPDAARYMAYDGTTGGYDDVNDATLSYFRAYYAMLSFDPEEFGLSEADATTMLGFFCLDTDLSKVDYSHMTAGYSNYNASWGDFIQLGPRDLKATPENTVFGDVALGPMKLIVQWMSEGKVLEVDQVQSGETVTYDGATPTKAGTKDVTYTFDKWDGYTAGMKITANTVFNALFTASVTGYEVDGNKEASVKVDNDSSTISTSAVNSVKEDAASGKINDFKIELKTGSITLDKTAIGSLSGNVDASVKNVDKADMSEAVKKVAGDRPVYDINLGDKHEFNGGKLTISLPYTLAEGEDAKGVFIYYIDVNGNATKVNCDYADGQVTFTVDHLSTYAIMYEEPASEKDTSLNGIVIGLTVALILLVSFGYFALTGKKQ